MTAHCPGCDPRPTDPLTEVTERCGDHRQDLTGTADCLVVGPLWQPFVTAEGEGAVNRDMCALLHRDHAEPE